MSYQNKSTTWRISWHLPCAERKTIRQQVHKQLYWALNWCQSSLHLSAPYTVDEVDKGVSNTKYRKVAEMNRICSDFLKNLGPKARRWLAHLFSYIHSSGIIPKEWKVVKIIAILKPGKETTDPKSYWPTPFLSRCYKLWERLLIQRLQTMLENWSPKSRPELESVASAVTRCWT